MPLQFNKNKMMISLPYPYLKEDQATMEIALHLTMDLWILRVIMSKIQVILYVKEENRQRQICIVIILVQSTKVIYLKIKENSSKIVFVFLLIYLYLEVNSYLQIQKMQNKRLLMIFLKVKKQKKGHKLAKISLRSLKLRKTQEVNNKKMAIYSKEIIKRQQK